MELCSVGVREALIRIVTEKAGNGVVERIEECETISD